MKSIKYLLILLLSVFAFNGFAQGYKIELKNGRTATVRTSDTNRIKFYFDAGVPVYLLSFNSGKSMTLNADSTESITFVSSQDVETNIFVRTIRLSDVSLSMTVGQTAALTARVLPTEAFIKDIIWASDNPDVATVDEYGNISAKSAGTANISVSSTDGSGVEATCKVTVEYEYVDLGLSDGTLWATVNVGAISPIDYGDHFAWGETSPKTTYTWDTYFDSKNGSSTDFMKYATDKKQELDLEDDAAYVNWGENWRMPTYEQEIELMEETYHEWTWNLENTGVGGIIFYKAKSPDDKGKWENPSASYSLEDIHIFIPAAGFCLPDTALFVGSSGYIWSRNLQTESSCAYGIHFYKNGYIVDSRPTVNDAIRATGYSVRPVCSFINKEVSNCTFNVTETAIYVNESYTQTVTTNSDGAVTYSSSDESIATVDAATGEVKALKAGTVTITAKTALTDTYIVGSASYTVTVKEHEYVDLGLSVKWASCNIGAYSPDDYGLYFAWGETTGYTSDPSDGHSFEWANLKYCGTTVSGPFSKYVATRTYGTVDNKTTLEPEDDAATVNWGSDWRMPTYDEQAELLSGCYWEWTSDYNGTGKSGYIVYKAKSDADRGVRRLGNSSDVTTVASYSLDDTHIFLVTAGYRDYNYLAESTTFGCYWSSSLYRVRSCYGRILIFNSGELRCSQNNRFTGRPVRPVYALDVRQTPQCSFGTADKTIYVNESYTQTVTTNSDGAVTYSSSDESIATVDAATGEVKALKAGTVTITAKTALTDTYIVGSASYTVTVKEHEYVDLGLSVKWATYNVGAASPEDYGKYYAWGETEPKEAYYRDWSNYKYCNGTQYSMNKYCIDSSHGTVDNKRVLEPEDDAATVNWGDNWRMPTLDEINELKNNCTSTYTTINGIEGRKFVSNINGNSIFLPSAGQYQNTTFDQETSYYSQSNVETTGMYWTSTVFSSNSCEASSFIIGESFYKTWGSFRCMGRPVRAVRE